LRAIIQGIRVIEREARRLFNIYWQHRFTTNTPAIIIIEPISYSWSLDGRAGAVTRCGSGPDAQHG
jgi:hypothetical protein